MTDFIDSKQSEVYDRRLVLFKPLQDGVVDISASLVRKRTDDDVDVSW